MTTIVSEIGTLPGLKALIWILQTAGIIFICYLIFLFVQGVINYKRLTRIKKIEENLESVNKTLKQINKKLSVKTK